MVTPVFFALLSSAAVGTWPRACPLDQNELRHLAADRTEGMPDQAVALQLSSQNINESAADMSRPERTQRSRIHGRSDHLG